MTVYGTANFSKNWFRLKSFTISDATFDMGNFYGYNYISLIEKGIKPEIIKFHPSAWWFSRNIYLWRVCSLLNNIFRHLKIYKPETMLLKEIECAHNRFPQNNIGLHDFASSKYMTNDKILSFIKKLKQKNIDLSKIIVCETELSGCYRHKDYAKENYIKPIYIFGMSDNDNGKRIHNFFKKGAFFE